MEFQLNSALKAIKQNTKFAKRCIYERYKNDVVNVVDMLSRDIIT